MEGSNVEQITDAEFGVLELVSPEQIEAGEFACITLRYIAGAAGLQQGATLTIWTDSDSDWAKPQVGDPSADGYLKVRPPSGCSTSVHTPDHKSFVVTVMSGNLTQGDAIEIILGDTSDGGRGIRAQTFYESRRNFRCEVDPGGDAVSWTPMGAETRGDTVLSRWDPPTQEAIEAGTGSAVTAVLRVTGGDATSLSAIAPSDIELGSEFALQLKASDRWGNPAQKYRGTVEVTSPGLVLPGGNSLEFSEEDEGVHRVEGAVFSEEGATRIDLQDRENNLVASSNQIRIAQQLPALKLFWGDPHSGQIGDASKIGDYFRYARDVSALDFAGYQRNDSAHSTDEYEVQQVEEKAFHEPGRFVPLPGFEWSGILEAGGHHNVYFGRFDQPMKRWNGAERLGRPDESDLPHVRDLHNYYRGTDTVITPHVGGQHADLQWHDPSLEPAVEVTSTHGSFEWILRESIERGYEMGFVGGNDCHTGRAGDDRPGYQERRYSKGGLTGIYADQLTLKSILEAMKAKRLYATTGARIRAAVTVDGHFIGEKYSCGSKCEIKVDVEGTGPLERIEVYRGLNLIHTEVVAAPATGKKIRVLWDGASRWSSYSGIRWDGHVDVADGEIGDVMSIRFDSPRSNYERVGSSRLSLNGWACGYPSGVVFELAQSTESEITVAMNSSLIVGPTFADHGEKNALRRMSHAPGDSVRVGGTLEQLANGPMRVDLGHSNRSVILELAPEPDTDRSAFTVIDDDVQPGVNPYWVKIVQQDMEMAWISPVFADFSVD
jgi:hypothetical protein